MQTYNIPIQHNLCEQSTHIHEEEAPTVLEACRVSYAIGCTTLVAHVSLALHTGEVLALVGPNGAGKTTLLRLLSGELKPSDGQIRLNGIPYQQFNARQQAKQRAVMRQQHGMAFSFTALEVALMGRYPHVERHGETHHDVVIARHALEQTETLQFEHRACPTLSGGEQARVTLARVLAQEAPILLLDEPTAALDLRYQHDTLRFARALADDGGAVLVVLHDLNLAATYANTIGIMSHGNLVALGTPWEVLTTPLLESVYGLPIVIHPHPLLAIPLVLAMPEEEKSL